MKSKWPVTISSVRIKFESVEQVQSDPEGGSLDSNNNPFVSLLAGSDLDWLRPTNPTYQN